MTPILSKPTNRKRRIGVRVQDGVFGALRQRADHENKTVSEWCSEQLSEIARGASPFQIAVVSEVAALQNITINLIHEMARSRTLSKERIQQILDAAHASKFRDAEEKLRRAHSRPEHFGGVSSRNESAG
jgi:hypothetical protein